MNKPRVQKSTLLSAKDSGLAPLFTAPINSSIPTGITTLFPAKSLGYSLAISIALVKTSNPVYEQLPSLLPPGNIATTDFGLHNTRTPPLAIFKATVKAHLHQQFKLYKLRLRQYYFPYDWCIGDALAQVTGNTLTFTL